MAHDDRQLHLDKRRGKFLGVCAGLADYLRIDAWVVRLAFVLALVFGPRFFGAVGAWVWLIVPGYFILWLCLDRRQGPPTAGRRLYRNRRDGKILGVCAGLANYLGISTLPVRLLTVVAFFLSGTTAGIVYIGAYFLLDDTPDKADVTVRSHNTSEDTATEKQGSKTAYSDTLAQCEKNLHEVQERITRLEAYTTSRHYRLHREFRDMG